MNVLSVQNPDNILFMEKWGNPKNNPIVHPIRKCYNLYAKIQKSITRRRKVLSMGLFSRKPKIDMEEAQKNKVKMRRLFNQAVSDGDSYQILYATTGSTWKESGLFSDTRVYQFISFVFGYRETDCKIVAVPVNIELTEFSEPLEIQIAEVKAIKYRKKEDSMDMDFSTRGRRSMYFDFGDIEQNSKSFVDNVSQAEERQKLISFLEQYKAKL